jgi:4-diphosphocytidyl-2C-methyl-D-erythritol kinase
MKADYHPITTIAQETDLKDEIMNILHRNTRTNICHKTVLSNNSSQDESYVRPKGKARIWQ